MRKSKQFIGSLMLLLAALMWGLSYGIQNILSQNMKDFTIIFFKGFGGFFLLLFCFFKHRSFDLKTIVCGAIVGLVNGTGLILQQIGISNTSVSKASFISSLYIVFVPIFGYMVKRRPKFKFWIAIVMACVGMYFLCFNGEMSINDGDLITLLAAVTFGLQIVLIDVFVRDCDLLVFCGVQQATVALMSGIIMLIFERPNFQEFGNVIWPILYVMFVSGLAAQILQNRYQKDVEPALASLLMSFESVFGALGGWLLLNQTLSTREIIGCAIIFVSILIAE